MPDEQRQSSMMYRRAALEPSSYDADARTIEIVWSTGAGVARRDWMTGKRYTEVLDLAGADLSRLNDGAPLLDSHDSYSSRSVIGVFVPGSARIEAGKGVATVRLSAAESARDAVEKIVEGVLRNVSVGYDVHEWRIEKNEMDGTETRTAVAWTPAEGSMVAIAADAGSQVRAAERETPAQETPMTEPTKPTAPVVDIDSVRAEAAAAERARVTEIGALARAHGYDAAKHIAEGHSVDQVRAAILDAKVAAQAKTEVNGSHRGQVTTDAADHRRAGLEQAIGLRMGIVPEAEVAAGPGRRYAGRSLESMLRQALTDEGIDCSDMGRDGVWRRLTDPMQRRSHSTSDFPLALANAMHKTLLGSYSMAPTTWERWTMRKGFRDFRPHPVVGMGSAPQLDLLPENAAITYGTVGEQSNSVQAFTYAKGLRFSEEVFINDDLDAITQSLRTWGMVAARKAEALCVAVLTTNANLTDGTALFASGHSNIIASATTPTTVANIDAAVQILDAQTEPGGQRMALMPEMLLVSSGYDLQARQALGLVVSAQTSASNVIPEGSSLSGLQVVKVPDLPADRKSVV